MNCASNFSRHVCAHRVCTSCRCAFDHTCPDRALHIYVASLCVLAPAQLQVCNHVDTTRTRSVKAKVADINEPCDYVILAHPDTVGASATRTAPHPGHPSCPLFVASLHTAHRPIAASSSSLKLMLAFFMQELEAPVVDAGVMNRGSRFYGHGLCCPVRHACASFTLARSSLTRRDRVPCRD